jgi:hypothetical protein
VIFCIVPSLPLNVITPEVALGPPAPVYVPDELGNDTSHFHVFVSRCVHVTVNVCVLPSESKTVTALFTGTVSSPLSSFESTEVVFGLPVRADQSSLNEDAPVEIT